MLALCCISHWTQTSCHCASETLQLRPLGFFFFCFFFAHGERVSARPWEQQTIKRKSSIRLQISKEKPHQKRLPVLTTFTTSAHLESRRGRSVPGNRSASLRAFIHILTAPQSQKTTQINVWKWYLLSSSPWPLAKSTAALSSSANRISTKLNMSKY